MSPNTPDVQKPLPLNAKPKITPCYFEVNQRNVATTTPHLAARPN